MAERAEEVKKKAAEEETANNKPSSQSQNGQLTMFRSGVAKYINMETPQQ
jgi:hypothetical protein